MVKAVLMKPNLTSSELEFDNDIDFLPVDMDTIMTISQLVGWVDSLQATKLLRLDSEGNLLTSSEGTAGDELQCSVSSPVTTATLIVSSRSNRKSLLVKNTGSESVFIGYDPSVSTTTGFELTVGASLTLDNYVGAVYGIVASSSTTVRIMEVV